MDGPALKGAPLPKKKALPRKGLLFWFGLSALFFQRQEGRIGLQPLSRFMKRSIPSSALLIVSIETA